MTYSRSDDDTEELPALTRYYCSDCGWFEWGPATTHFVCLSCLRLRHR